MCIKSIIDIHKFYRPSFSNDVTRFLEFVKEVYHDLKLRALDIFEPKMKIEVPSITDVNIDAEVRNAFTVTNVYTQEVKPDGSLMVYHILPKSRFSLKVMQEIPILVVLMYQLFKQHIHQNVSDFIPLIMDFINIKPTEEQKRSVNFSEEVFIDFMAAQVKTLSFLAYVIKIYQDSVERHSVTLVQGMMNLLANCPPSVTNMRKEFFIAARHILSAQEIRPKFLQVLDDLMDEEILIGQGYTIRDSLRPLAYSTLADLTHHIRSHLSISKIARAIDVYGRNMHDNTLPFSIQQMSIRLILNLVECIKHRVVSPTSNNQGASTANNNSGEDALFIGTERRLLLQALRLCVLKVKAVADHCIPALESTCVPETSEDATSSPAKHRPRSIHAYLFANLPSFSSEVNDVGAFNDKNTSASDFTSVPISNADVSKVQEPHVVEPLARTQLSYTDVRTLVKALISGIRTMVANMIQCPHDTSQPNSVTEGPSTASKPSPAPRMLSPDELVVLTEYFTYGMRIIDIVQFVNRDGRLHLRSQPSSKSPDERLLIETFALTFAQLNPISFQEIFSCKIHEYVVWCSRSPSYTNVALHLLSQPNKTSHFGFILLSYLVDRLERLGDGTSESALYMRLLKLCFSSVNMTGTENELVMKLHLRRIVQGSMYYCLTAREPTAYLSLLRTLFRSIGGGAHDKLYREFFPLLPDMLTTLNRLLRSPHRSNARDLLGELCVIVPVRLSTLLPYLSLLMEPLVYVLNCNTVNQGLRTLELCVDNMQPDFLHNHLYQVRGDMLLALYNSLHSPSEYVQKMSFKVLGKLGRFNRTNLLETQRLRLSSTEGEAGPQLRFYLNEFRNQPIDMPVRSFVDAAVELLQDLTSDEASKIRSWEFLQSVCVAAFNLNHSQLSSLYGKDLYYNFLTNKTLTSQILQFIDDSMYRVSCPENLGAHVTTSNCCMSGDLYHHVMIMTMAGLFLAGLNKHLRDTHGDFLTFIVRHTTVLSIIQQFNPQQLINTCDSSSQLNTSVDSKKSSRVDDAHDSDVSHDNSTRLKMPYDDQSKYLDLFSVSQEIDSVFITTNQIPQSVNHEGNKTSSWLNPNIIIDSIMFVMGHEMKQLSRHMCVLLEIIHNTAFTVLSATAMTSQENAGDSYTTEQIKKAVANLDIFQHIGHVIVDMLYHSAWYVKWGACAAILCLARFIHPSWFCSNLMSLLRGLLCCINSLSNQMNQGAVVMAQDCARIVIAIVFAGLKDTNDTNNCTNVSTFEDEDMKSDKPTLPLTRKRSSASTQRRPVQVRRGRSAGSTTTIPDTPELSTNESTSNTIGETVGNDTKETEKVTYPRCVSSSSLLLDSVIRELLEFLLSENDSVRAEARCLLRLLGHTVGQPLCKLLASHWYKQIGHVLPLKVPNRLLDLPISTQLAILETNYFFSQSAKVKPSNKALDNSKPYDFDIDNNDDGVGLLRYDSSKRDDCVFLSDVRALLTQFEVTSEPPGAVNTNNNTSNSSAVNGGNNNNSNANPDYEKFQFTRTFPFSKNSSSTFKNPVLFSTNCMRFINLRVVACQILSVTWYLDVQKSRNLTALFKGLSCKNEYINEAAFLCLREFASKTNVDIELRHANMKQIIQNVRQASIRCTHAVQQLAYCAQLFPSTLSERLCEAIHSQLNTALEEAIEKQNSGSISSFISPNLELCTLLLDLFHSIPLATSKYVSLLIESIVNAEYALNIDLTSPLRLPLTRFLSRYPAETCALLLTGSRWPQDSRAHRLLLFALSCPQGQPIVDYLKVNYHILVDLVEPNEIEDSKGTSEQSEPLSLPKGGIHLTPACPRHLAIRVVHTIHQLSPNWLTTSKVAEKETSRSSTKYKSNQFSICETGLHPLVTSLLAYWQSDLFIRRQSNLTMVKLSKDTDTDPVLDECVKDLLESSAFVPSIPPDGTLCLPMDTDTSPSDPISLSGCPVYSGTTDHTHWDEPKLILDCLLDCYKSNPNHFDLLFMIIIGVTRLRYVADFDPLHSFLVEIISKSDVTWHRQLFLHFVSIIKNRLNSLHGNNLWRDSSPSAFGVNKILSTKEIYKLLCHLVLPCLSHALGKKQNEIFLGEPVNPFERNDSDLVHLFVSVLLEDPTVQTCTELRVMYYQIASLFVFYAPNYVHIGDTSKPGYRLQKFISFAEPCLTSSLSSVDLQDKYTGLQLLAHLIAKFNVLQTAAIQVFQCLAKGAHTETKKIVNPALDTFIPAWIKGPEDLMMLAQVTKKIMLEDHGIQSCVHILGMIVRHADLYYPIRHHLLPHIVAIVSRLSVQQLPIEQRRLALDMLYTTAQWDARCRREITENQSKNQTNAVTEPGDKNTMDCNVSTEQSSTTESNDSLIDKPQRDQLVNLMIRFACQALEGIQSGNLPEQLISRTLAQLEFALRSDVWGGETCEVRLGFLDRYFAPDDASSSSHSASSAVLNSSLNSNPIHGGGSSNSTPTSTPTGSHANSSTNAVGAAQATVLLMNMEVLRVLFSTLDSPTLLLNVKHFSAGLCNVLTKQLTNVRLFRSCAGLLRAMLERYPAEASHRQKITAYPELFDIYSAALKTIQDSFTMFSENASKTTLLTRLQSAFLLFTSTQVQSNPYAFVDRCIVQLVKLVDRLIQDVVTPNYGSSTQESGASAQLTDLLIMGLDMIKSRLNVVSHEMRKTIFGPNLCLIMDRARDPRLFCAVLQVLRDWINVPKSEEHFAPTAREKVNFFCRLWQAYPRWIDNSPEVAREILECIYDVYASGIVFKNHDLYVKLEQAFCCGLIAPFPEIRERFISLYLEASQIRFPANNSLRRVDTSMCSVSNENIVPGDSADIPTDKDPAPVDQSGSSNYSSASLLVRLLFLLVSNTWDEAHFRDGFWLPIFLDVLLCDLDTSMSPVLSSNSVCFRNIIDYFPNSTDLSSTNDIPYDDLDKQSNNQTAIDSIQQDDFKAFLDSQTEALRELNKLTIETGIRGMLCLAHKRPALATCMFNQLWPQIWDRLLLHQSETQCHSSDLPTGESSETNAVTQELSNSLQTSLALDPVQTSCLESAILCDNPLLNGHGLSPSEIRGFVIPQLVRFLTSDQHIHVTEPHPDSLGAFFTALTSCPDTLLIHLPLPAITYLGYNCNQWYTVGLFLESLCRYTSKFNTRCISNELMYSVNLPSGEQCDGNSSHIKSSEFPFRAAALSLITLYGEINDIDFLTSAWWYRISLRPKFNPLENSNDSLRSSSLLACLEYAQHGHLLRSLDCALDNLPSKQFFGSQGTVESSLYGGSTSVNRAVASTSSSTSSSNRKITLADSSLHLGDIINRAHLRDYCIKQLKQLGQWDTLESLVTSVQSSMTYSSGNANLSGGSSPGNTGGSGYWGLKADAAWRRSDWSEVYYCLARLANECPRSELPRYALIQAAACVVGRRASGLATTGNSNVDLDAYDPSDITSGSNSVSSSSAGNNTASTSAHSNVANITPLNNMVNMIHTSEHESHRVVNITLMEWRRLPLIVTTLHIPLLQIAHRAVEITEGNSLLAQYCGHVMSGPCHSSGVSGSAYSSPSQNSSGSSTPVTQPASSTSVNMRMPFTQALHDYKTIFKAWQSRPCSTADDLGFWHDIFSWRQVVEESIIGSYPFAQKLKSESNNLLAVCQREVALSQLQLARGARKHRFPTIAQQHLDRYARMNLPPLFEKTKQEIKLKLADLRKDELLEGLELMEKTNIQQFEKKDRARFFCYKAVFFSHFNKGDEATKNFGYATQMQDNLHKVWSIYGDFLENVYSSYPSAKREVAVSTTGIFAMQALMEAASVSGGLERKSRADIAKCLWLLTLDDVNGQQRLAHTFEARASRVRPEVFLPWLPDLVASLLRPEGRFIVPALRRVVALYPTILYGYLRGLQHQLATEVNNDQKLAEIIQNHQNKNNPFITAIHNRIASTLGSEKESVMKFGDLSGSSNRVSNTANSGGSLRRSGYSFNTQHYTSSPSSSKVGVNVSGGTYSSNSGVNSSNPSTIINSKKKKRVIVVMRGVEGERLNTSSPNLPAPQQQKYEVTEQSPSLANHPKKVVIRSPDFDPTTNADHEQIGYVSEDVEMTEPDDDTEVTDADRDDEDDDCNANEDIGLSETDSGPKVVNSESEPKISSSDANDAIGTASTNQERSVSVGYGNTVTGCLSNSAVHGLHHANILINQLRRKHSSRLYVVDLFTNEVGGRLRPTWAEHLLTQLSSILDYLQRLAWAHLHPGRSWCAKNLEYQTIPGWLANELKQISHDCGLPRNIFQFQQDTEDTVYSQSLPKSDSNSSASTSFRKEKSKSPKLKSNCRVSDCNKTKSDPDYISERDDVKSIIEPQKQSTLSTNPPVFNEVNRIAAEILLSECERDPYFKHFQKVLSTEMENLHNESILSIIQKLTRRWIPMVEQHVANLPRCSHITSYGARRLLELPHLLVSVNTSSAPSSGTTASNAPQVYSVFSPTPTIPCLELPGESGLLQSSGSNLGPLAAPHHFQNESNQQIGGFINNIPLYLHVAEIMPYVERVRCSTGQFSPPARRISIRASNGRLFFYDLACPITPPIVDLAVTHMDAICCAKYYEILNAISLKEPGNLELLTENDFCTPAYVSWRQTGPLQLFQVINTMLLGQPETAKRNLSLSIPRRMEVGPFGLYLTQVGSSVPAANVIIASACPLPSGNSINSPRLTALARPPAVVAGYSSVSPNKSQSNQSVPSTTEDAVKRYPWSLSFAEPNLSTDISIDQSVATDISEFLKTHIRIPSPPPGPLPNMLTVQTANLFHHPTIVGSSAMALEAIGRPAALEAGCYCACITLQGVLEKCSCKLVNSKANPKQKSDDAYQSVKSDQQEIKTNNIKSSGVTQVTDDTSFNSSCDTHPVGARNLVCLFYEQMLPLLNRNREITNQDFFKIFCHLSSRIPQNLYLRDPLFSNLGIFNKDDQTVNTESLTDQVEFPRGNLLQRWAEHQMLDSESYWLLRRSLAHSLGLHGLMERLFHLTALHPGCLSIDPRSGHAETHQVCFSLPGDSFPEPLPPISTERVFNQSHFLSCFLQTMLIQKNEKISRRRLSGSHYPSKFSNESGVTNNFGDGWFSDCRPVPFRLTPHLAGLVCLPGAPATVGPLAASFTTAAQALMVSQRDHTLTSLYRTFLRRDYILWHRGRQSAVYAYQLLMNGQDAYAKNELNQSYCGQYSMEIEGNVSSVINTRAPTLVSEMSNEQLISLVNLTLDSMSNKLRVASDYSGTEPKSWKLIHEAVKPTNLIHMNPSLLPWL
ncbi:unnamed protein product [Trichobilharzia szidati]|nr:unnamed protein product [Trichobilharzia szidati]